MERLQLVSGWNQNNNFKCSYSLGDFVCCTCCSTALLVREYLYLKSITWANITSCNNRKNRCMFLLHGEHILHKLIYDVGRVDVYCYFYKSSKMSTYRPYSIPPLLYEWTVNIKPCEFLKFWYGQIHSIIHTTTHVWTKSRKCVY